MDELPRIRLLVADDNEWVLEAFACLFLHYPDLEVTAVARNGKEAVALFRLHHPDITLMDLQMPEMNGVNAIKTICAAFPEAFILGMSASDFDGSHFRALLAGAAASFFKDIPAAELIALIRDCNDRNQAVCSGETASP
jgi:DNA-binding NarL/FixJ family response regulator